MLLNRQGEASKEERKDEHLSDDNTGGHRRLCSCALLTQDGVEQLELARLYREEAQAAPSKVRSPRHSSMASIRDPCENPARREPDPATFVPLAYPCASPLATAVRYRLEGRAQDTVEHDRTEIARTFCPVTP